MQPDKRSIQPIRSRLYHLEPIGVGTSQVESLTGYLTRLADAHRVPIYQVARHEIAPLLPGAWSSSDCAQLSVLLGKDAARLNGTRMTAGNWVSALEMLTLRTDLGALTLRAWGGVLPTRGLLRPTLAWCSACYAEWRALKRPVHQPLLWGLAVVTMCPDHRRQLSERCPRPDCGRPQPLLTSSFPAGHCAYCGEFLGDCVEYDVSRDDGVAGIIDDVTLAWQTWVATATAPLLVAAAMRTTAARREDVKATLARLLDPFAENPRPFSRAVGIDRTNVASWLKGDTIPSLPKLLRLCHVLEITPLQLLTDRGVPQTDVAAGSSASEPAPTTRRQPTRSRVSFDAEAARPRVLAAVESTDTPPTSVSRLARHLEISRGTLARDFPTECATLVARYHAARRTRRGEGQNRLIEEIRHAVQDLHGQGHYPSTTKVAAALANPHEFRRDFARAAWRDALRELRPELGQGQAHGND